MKYYKVEPKWKKSIYEYSTWSNEDKSKTFTMEEMYRWGHVIIKVDDEIDETIEDYIGDANDPNNEFEISVYEDAEVDDQCSLYFEECVGITNEELDEQYEDRGWDLLEEDYGGEPDDFWKVFHGELKVTDVTEEYHNE